MATRTITVCDRCEADEADALFLHIIGVGSKVVDLCPGCQEVSGLTKLLMVIDECGVPVDRAEPTVRAPLGESWPCPDCGVPLTTRTGVINHLVGVHGMPSDKVEASKRVPPRNDKSAWATCPDCGYLSVYGPGISLHMKGTHPDTKSSVPIMGQAEAASA